MKKTFHLNALSAVLSSKMTVYGAKGQDISRQMEDNIRQNRFGRANRILFPNQTADLHLFLRFELRARTDHGMIKR
ncbi:MAG: hypothetical protein AAGF25_11890 [Pseudomonadota bacterium]